MSILKVTLFSLRLVEHKTIQKDIETQMNMELKVLTTAQNNM